MKASVTKQIARTVKQLNYIQDLSAYQITIQYEQEGSCSTSTFILPEQFLFPYTVIQLPNLPATQATEMEVPNQEISHLTDNPPSQLAGQQEVQEVKEMPVEQKRLLDFDLWEEQNPQYMDRLRREVMRVRPKPNRKRMKM